MSQPSWGRRLRVASRPLRHGIAYAVLRALVGLLRILPLSVSLALCSGLARGAGALARADSKRMRVQLRRLNDPPSVGDCWADLGRRFAELVNAKRILPDIDVVGLEAARQTVSSGKGALVATLHLGNWELMAAKLAAVMLPVLSVAARPKNGPLYGWLARERQRLGVRTLTPGGGARQAVAALRDGQAVALFVDQNVGRRQREILFLNHPAPTPTTWPRLLDATDAEPWLAYTFRRADGRHEIVLERAPADLQALTDQIGRLVQTYPAQWVWLHDRWGDEV